MDFAIRTEDMPAEMHLLLSDYPRENWPEHPGFHEAVQHWLGAHQMFRQLAQIVRTDTQGYLDRDLEERAYAARLSRYGSLLLRNLQGHHGWEDHVFFPQLSAADPRFDAGLDLLETDHSDLDQVLDAFAISGNRALHQIELDAPEALETASDVLAQAETIERFLNRHLGDEEDLAVPIILHHRLRG